MPLDFRPKVNAAREAADADDMAEGMAGPEPDGDEQEPMLCCPKCKTMFPLSEGIPDPNATADSASPPPDEPEGDFDGFQLRG